jgi:MFS family permease
VEEESVGYVGQLVGALLFGWVAQRYGRMKAMVWSVCVGLPVAACVLHGPGPGTGGLAQCRLHLENVFLAFIVAALACVITALFAVETKGRVLEEVSP